MSTVRHRETLRLFPTLVGVFDVEASGLSEIAAAILEREARLPTFPRGERTSWQSESDLLTWSPACHALGEVFVEAILNVGRASQGIFLAAWANVLRRGDYFTPHTHPDATWSGVLYVDAGDSSEGSGGFISFRDPRGGAGMVPSLLRPEDAAGTIHHYPRTGELLVFPAWLIHWVVPYTGDLPRISVAFNAR